MNENGRNDSELSYGLTQKQEQAITALLTHPSIEAAAEKAEVSKTSIYKWLREQAFLEELQKRRREIITQALSGLAGLLNRAVDELGRLLEPGVATTQTKRLVCRDIIEFNFKASEIEDIKNRIEALEGTPLNRD